MKVMPIKCHFVFSWFGLSPSVNLVGPIFLFHRPIGLLASGVYLVSCPNITYPRKSPTIYYISLHFLLQSDDRGVVDCCKERPEDYSGRGTIDTTPIVTLHIIL